MQGLVLPLPQNHIWLVLGFCDAEVCFFSSLKTERIARAVHLALPHLTIVCWRGLALDAAARAFSVGFYASLAKDEPPSVAYDAGRAEMSRRGYREGDPDDYLHPHGHPHLRGPRQRDCTGCIPPVHGEVVLVGGGRTVGGVFA